MERKLATDWTKHIKDPKQKADFEVTVRNSTVALSRLKDLLQDKIKAAEEASIASKSYDTPNWALKQSDTIGYKRATKEVDQLLSFLE